MSDKEYIDYLEYKERKVEREIPLQEEVEPEVVEYPEDVAVLLAGASKFVEALENNNEIERAKKHKVLIDEFVEKYKNESTDDSKSSCVDRFKLRGLKVELEHFTELRDAEIREQNELWGKGCHVEAREKQVQIDRIKTHIENLETSRKQLIS